MRFVEVLGDVGADECERVGEAGGVGVDVVAFFWAEGGGVSGGLAKGAGGGGGGGGRKKGLESLLCSVSFSNCFRSALCFSTVVLLVIVDENRDWDSNGRASRMSCCLFSLRLISLVFFTLEM